MLAFTTELRGSRKGERHGGLQLLEINPERGQGQAANILDWDIHDVDWQGTGGGRGLRGIAFDNERVYVAASDLLMVFTPSFKLIGSFRSPYLKHCHQIACWEGRVYLTSTAHDAILAFDLATSKFSWGLHIEADHAGVQGTPFDPQGVLGPPLGNALHLTSIHCDARGLFVSGARSGGLLHFDGQRIVRLVTLPTGANDCRPWRDGVLFNDTEADTVRFLTPDQNHVFQVPKWPEDELTGVDPQDSGSIRQGFARGLCVIDEATFAAGSSPSTITLHNIETMKTTLSINLSTDIREAIQAIAVWPFGMEPLESAID